MRVSLPSSPSGGFGYQAFQCIYGYPDAFGTLQNPQGVYVHDSCGKT